MLDNYIIFVFNGVKTNPSLYRQTQQQAEEKTDYIEPYYPFKEERFRVKLGLPIEQEIKRTYVITENYPLQPQWSVEFRNGIPPYKSLKVEMYLEMQVDDCDFEDDELELDMSDYEPDCDYEEDYYNNFVEPINLYDYTLSSLVIPPYYYVINPQIS